MPDKPIAFIRQPGDLDLERTELADILLAFLAPQIGNFNVDQVVIARLGITRSTS
jgi:hypothetical protein